VGVRADGAAVAYYGWTPDGGSAVDDGASAYSYVVCYGCGLFGGSVVVEVEVL